MNALKNVLFFGLLLAVLCGVYLSLNRSPEAPLPAGLSGDTTKPMVDLGQQMGPPQTNIPGPASSNPPGFPSQPPPMNTPPATTGGTAPPFQAPVTAATTSEAPPWPSASSSNSLPPPPSGAAGGGSLAPPPGGLAALPPPPTVAPGSNYPSGVRDPFGPGSVSGLGNVSPPAPPSTATLPSPADHPAPVRLDFIMQQVKLRVDENRFADALLRLSQLYGSPDLSPSQSREVTRILDQLAAKVIYSREHLLENDRYLVQAGDTLDSIADRCKVPALLLARINGIRDPQNLPPGKELKVLQGPFIAFINTDRSEMMLELNCCYAGRFNVALSNDLSLTLNTDSSHAWGMNTVRDKRTPTAATGGGSGKQWIELGNASGNITMQGTSDTRVTAGGSSRNTIWLSEQDMDDVFGILSVGSRVIIQR